MSLIRNILNSKFADRFRRTLALKSGIYCKIKVLAPSVSEDMRTAKILNHYGIIQVLDVGANSGQFAEGIIDFGFKGQIISFEPVSDTYRALVKRANKYSNWKTFNSAIGNTDGAIEINVPTETQFSSIKEIKSEFTAKLAEAKTLRKEKVVIHKLDSLIGKQFDINQPTLLKIDTQGFEKEVLEGASEVLKIVKGLKLEIPLSKNLEIYNDVEWDIVDYIKKFNDWGFTCVSISSVTADKQTGIVSEVDGIFIRI